MADSIEGSISHRASRPPSNADIRALIGQASWGRYQTALKGLAELGLEPEFYRYGPSGGWTLRFQINHVTGCALYLSGALIGLVAIGPRAEAALEEDPKSDDQMRRLVQATPRKGKTRWVQMPLRGQEEVRRFLTLVGVKLRAWQAAKVPKGAKAAKVEKASKPTKAAKVKRTAKATAKPKKPAKPAKGARAAKGKQKSKAAVSHKPRRRTTPAAAGRKKAGTPPRRSAARRSSRG